MLLSTRTKIALGRGLRAPIMIGRRCAGLGPEATVRRGDLRWQLDLREGIDFAIYVFGAFERETVRAFSRLIAPGAVVFDIGANVGAHTLQLARIVGGEGRVFAFEPTAFAFAKLSRNLALNPDMAGRVTAEQAMLVADGDASLPQALYSSWPLSGDAGAHPRHQGCLKSTDGAAVTTVDAYVEQHGIERIDLFKIDVDGFECDVLGGARRTLERLRPRIIMELAPYTLIERGTDVAALLDILGPAGYRLRDLDGRRDLPADAGALEALVPAGSSINIHAAPGAAA